MDKFLIEGPCRVKGEVSISGSKNASLPILAATLLFDKPVIIKNLPRVRDIKTMLSLLKSLGSRIILSKDKKNVKIINRKNLIIAYEPVWAIGTGKTPTLEEINGIHEDIRNLLVKNIGKAGSKSISILYGGSVNPSNAFNILNLDQVDGALVGGASLKSKDFSKIIDSYP